MENCHSSNLRPQQKKNLKDHICNICNQEVQSFVWCLRDDHANTSTL